MKFQIENGRHSGIHSRGELAQSLGLSLARRRGVRLAHSALLRSSLCPRTHPSGRCFYWFQRCCRIFWEQSFERLRLHTGLPTQAIAKVANFALVLSRLTSVLPKF